MSLLEKKQLKAWPGGYLTGNIDALKEEGLLAQVRMRRRQLSQMTTALDPQSAKRRIPDGQYHISRKVDGEFTCLVWRDGEIFTLNPGGTLRAAAPFMAEAAERLKGVKSALIGGELYVQCGDGKRPRVHDVVRVARNPANAEEVAQLAFAVFDIYELDGDDLSVSYIDSLAMNEKLFATGELIHPVETVAGENARAVLKQFKQWVLEDGAEGVVARSPTAGVFKVKPRHSLDIAVVGFSEGIDERSGMVHDLLCAVVRPTGRYQLVAKVGGGFSDEERMSIFKQLSRRVVESDYREVNSDRVAYQMIKPGLVVEIECLDLISRTSRGNTIEKMILEWTGKTWEGVRRLPLVSVLSPQFIRLRDDKSASEEDTGIKQLGAIVDIPDIDRVAKEISLPEAEVIARAVATKMAKEKTMVRKVIVIKTNKEKVSQDFPAYVLYVTNFSPNRATKLQTVVKVSVDREQIMELFEQAKTEQFKKGWVEV
ncbi:MAG: hypothetical protein AB8B63_24605 [Granulosicoccus sp.]